MYRVLLLVIVLPGSTFAQSAGPQAPGGEIFRCSQPDGTVAFQGMPCAEANTETDADPAADDEAREEEPTEASPFDFVNPFDEPPQDAEPMMTADPAPLSAGRAECEKSARDAIDAIDLKMREGYSKAEGQAYLARLLQLTRALRACKTL